MRYIKQEVVPGPVTISSLLALKSPAVEMVMSGFGGAFSRLHMPAGQAPASIVHALGEQHFLALFIKDDRAAPNS